MRAPIFIETAQSGDKGVPICCKLMTELFRKKVAPLPSGSTIAEIRAALAALKQRNITPSVFVLHVHGVESLLSELDVLIGSVPVLFFMRRIFTETLISTGGTRLFIRDKTLVQLERMTPRPNCVWTYGSKTVDAVSAKCADVLIQFLKDGNFKRIEEQSDAPCFAPRTVFVPPAPPAPFSASAPELTSSRIFTKDVSAGVHGTIEQLGLATLLMTFEMEKKTGVMELTRGEEVAQIFFRDGKIICAELEGPGVPAECECGEECIYYLLTWATGGFGFAQIDPEMEDEINAPTTRLLMEGARRMDNRQNRTPAQTANSAIA